MSHIASTDTSNSPSHRSNTRSVKSMASALKSHGWSKSSSRTYNDGSHNFKNNGYEESHTHPNHPGHVVRIGRSRHGHMWAHDHSGKQKGLGDDHRDLHRHLSQFHGSTNESLEETRKPRAWKPRDPWKPDTPPGPSKEQLRNEREAKKAAKAMIANREKAKTNESLAVAQKALLMLESKGAKLLADHGWKAGPNKFGKHTIYSHPNHPKQIISHSSKSWSHTDLGGEGVLRSGSDHASLAHHLKTFGKK